MTKEITTALRGMGILGIVLHNYCHFLGLAVKENEYTFTAEKPRLFLEQMMVMDANWPVHLFSFLGHYGVPLFLFVSGYGLVMKYEKAYRRPEQPAWQWIGKHLAKLLKLMLPAFVLFVAVYFLRHNDGLRVYSIPRVLAHLTMTVNFVYFDPDHIIKPGPFWFFGLMAQLYLVYRLLLYRWRNPWVALALVGVCWLSETLCLVADDGMAWLNYLRYNFVGGVLPFCMGVLCGRQEWDVVVKSRGAWAVVAVVSAVCVVAGSLWFWSWLWVPVFVVAGAVATAQLLPRRLLAMSVWFGAISSSLFVMHPLLRELIIWHYAKQDIYSGLAVYMLASVAAAMLYKKYVVRK